MKQNDNSRDCFLRLYRTMDWITTSWLKFLQSIIISHQVNAMNCRNTVGFSADGNRQRGSVLSEEASQMTGLLKVKYSKASWQYLMLGTDAEYSFSELMGLWFQIVHWDAIWLVQQFLAQDFKVLHHVCTSSCFLAFSCSFCPLSGKG